MRGSHRFSHFLKKNRKTAEKNEALFSVLSDFFEVGGYIIPLI